MQDYISRLIDCGIPRAIAVSICMKFKRQKRMADLALYVEAVEQECDADVDLL